LPGLRRMRFVRGRTFDKQRIRHGTGKKIKL
jgi:hypothetical protein